MHTRCSEIFLDCCPSFMSAMCVICDDVCTCSSSGQDDVQVAVNVRHANKATTALQRHAQRLIDARRRAEASQAPKMLPVAVKPVFEPPPEEPPFYGEQLLFVHFIPPSLRKKGKEKIPWIVHSTCSGHDGSGKQAQCHEAHHVHFRSVTNFETFEGVATGQACSCSVAQHHLRGIGCLRWDGLIAVIESTEVAARCSVEVQTELEQYEMETQTGADEQCEMPTQTECEQFDALTQTEVETGTVEQVRQDRGALLIRVREAEIHAMAADTALRTMQREHKAQLAALHSRTAELEARLVELEPAATAGPSVASLGLSLGLDVVADAARAMADATKVVDAKRVARAEAAAAIASGGMSVEAGSDRIGSDRSVEAAGAGMAGSDRIVSGTEISAFRSAHVGSARRLIAPDAAAYCEPPSRPAASQGTPPQRARAEYRAEDEEDVELLGLKKLLARETPQPKTGQMRPADITGCGWEPLQHRSLAQYAMRARLKPAASVGVAWLE